MFLLYAGATIFQNSPLCVGIKFDSTKESLIDKSHRPTVSTLMLIRMKKSSGLKIITDEIPRYQYVNYMANFVPAKDIERTPEHYTVYTVGLDIQVLLPLPKR